MASNSSINKLAEKTKKKSRPSFLMLIAQVFKFGFKSKAKEGSHCSSSSSGDVEKSPSKQSPSQELEKVKFLESSPLPGKKGSPERRKSRGKLFRAKHTSMPTRLEIVRVGAVNSSSPCSDSSSSNVLWRDQFGAEELAGLLLTPREMERQEIINELVATEKDYVSDLTLIDELYIKPLSQSKFVTETEVKGIFLNLPALLTLHQFFLTALQKRVNSQKPIVKDISDIMLEWIKELTIYDEYLVPQRRALAEYEHLIGTNKRFAGFIKTQSELPESRSLDLMSYLIKPFQRLLKYPLLIRNLLEVSSSGTVDYLNAARSHHALESLINRIQESKFRQEQAPTLEAWNQKIPGAARLRLADPRRKLWLEGPLTVVNTEIPSSPSTYPISHHKRSNSKGGSSISRETVYFALFGDILIHVPEQYRKGLTKFQLLSSPHPTTTLCKVTDVRNLSDHVLSEVQRHWFIVDTIDTNSKKLIIEAQDEDQKNLWMENFRLAIPTHTGS